MRKFLSTIVICVLLLALLAVPMMINAADTDPQDADLTYTAKYDATASWTKKGESSNKFVATSWSKTTFYHNNEKWNGVILLFGVTADNYDATESVMLNIDEFQYQPKNTNDGSPVNLTADDAFVVVQMDLKWSATDDTFESFVLNNGRSGGEAKVKKDGSFVTYSVAPGANEGDPDVITEIPIGTLTEGWNTLTAFYVPQYAEDYVTLTGYNVHFMVNGDYTQYTKLSQVVALPSYVLKTSKVFTEQFAGGYLCGMDKNANPKGAGTYSVKNFKTFAVDADMGIVTLSFGDAANSIKAVPDDVITLPTVDGIDAWYLGTTSYAAGAEYTVVDNVAFVPHYTAHTFDKEVVDAKHLAVEGNCTTESTYYKSCMCGENGTETFLGSKVASKHASEEFTYVFDGDEFYYTHTKKHACCDVVAATGVDCSFGTGDACEFCGQAAPAAGFATASFDGVYDEIRLVKGNSITLPTLAYLTGWKVGDTVYEPGATVVMDGDKTFVGLFEKTSFEYGYDSTAGWVNNTRDNDWGSSNRSDNDGWTGGVLWFKNYVYDAENKTLTIISKKAEGNSIQFYPYRTWHQEGGYKDSDTSKQLLYGENAFVLSFDYLYTAEGFTGFYINEVLTVAADGTIKTNSGNIVGSLVEGWNTITLYCFANLDGNNAVQSWNTYVALNTPIAAVLSVGDIYKNAAGTWAQKALGHTAPFMHIKLNDSTATAEAPLSYTFRNFKIAKFVEPTAATITFDDLSPAMTDSFVGETIILPTVDGVVSWTVDGVNYRGGDSYTIPSATVVFVATTEAHIADQELGAFYEEIKWAEGDELVTKIGQLITMLENPILDTTTENYTTASAFIDTTIANWEKNITDSLEVEEGVEETRQEQFNRLRSAITTYNSAKQYISTEVTAALTAAVNEYNAFVESVNADVVEATAIAVSISTYKLPSTEMTAILADIKSKIEE